MDWDEAGEYVAELNEVKWAGHDDWRLPTVNELLTLLTAPPIDSDYCLDPLFDPEKKWLWSADRRSAVAAWYVSAEIGFAAWQDQTCRSFVRAVRSQF